MNGKTGKRRKSTTYIRLREYVGDWVNDKTCKGFSIDGQGNSYKGDFLDGEMEGEGTYTFKSGNTYVGTFVKGKKHVLALPMKMA